MLDVFGTRTTGPAVTATFRTTRAHLAILLLAVTSLAGSACSPAAGPLGTPSSPIPVAEASVEVPSMDATPGTAAPSATTTSGAASPSAVPTTVAPTAAPSALGTTIVRAYFFLGSPTGSGGLVPVLREIPKTQAVGSAALRALLAGPSAGELAAAPALYTNVPTGTTLLGLSIGGGVATVNLSGTFGSGDAATVRGQLAQLVFTLTQFSTVTGVVIELDGHVIVSFGSVTLGSVVGRTDFRTQLPAIFVDRPAWGAAAGNPLTVTGVANVFEATFRVQLLGATRGLLVDRQVMASCGTGCWGDYNATIPYEVSQAQWGTLRVFDISAKDGSHQDVTEYPVWLVPAG
jgi:spore germination protein GerM